MSGDSLEALHAFVHGRVQGVGFRFFVERHANRLGLVGYTRNLGDGSVEVLVEGPRPALEQMASELRRGPRMAHVDRVDASWKDASGGFEAFAIRG
jgi:acylphosphatase